MINDLGWRDLIDMQYMPNSILHYKIVNHEVNTHLEGIFILSKGGTKTSQEHNKFIPLGSNFLK